MSWGDRILARWTGLCLFVLLDGAWSHPATRRQPYCFNVNLGISSLKWALISCKQQPCDSWKHSCKMTAQGGLDAILKVDLLEKMGFMVKVSPLKSKWHFVSVSEKHTELIRLLFKRSNTCINLCRTGAGDCVRWSWLLLAKWGTFLRWGCLNAVPMCISSNAWAEMLGPMPIKEKYTKTLPRRCLGLECHGPAPQSPGLWPEWWPQLWRWKLLPLGILWVWGVPRVAKGPHTT